MKLRKFALAVIIAGIVLPMAACSSNASGGGSASGGEKTIIMSFWASGQADQKVWQHVADMVHKKYPNLTVKLQTAAWNDYWTKLPTTLAGSDAPCVVGMSVPRVQQFSNLFVPLETYMNETGIKASDFAAADMKAFQTDGQQMAVPYDYGPDVIYYNKDEFKAAGLAYPKNGWTVAEFEKDAKALTKGSQYGFALNNAIDAMNTWGPTIGGVQAVNPAGKLDLTSAGMKKTLAWYAGLHTTQKVSAPLAGSSETDGPSFIAGNAAMYASGPWDMVNVKTTAKFSAGIVTLPVGPGGPGTPVSGSGFGISQKCTDKADAAKAISVITGDKALAYLGSQGRAFPARPAQQHSWYAEAVAGSRATLEQAEKAGEPYRSTANWNQISVAWANGVTSVINGNSSADSFLQSLQSSYAS